MRKLNTFVHVFANSLLPLDTYYKKLKKVSFGFSLKYFTALVLFVTFFAVSITLVKTLFVENNIYTLTSEVVQTAHDYPQELVIRIRDGKLMTTVDHPYIVWYEYQGVPHPIIVIDPQATPAKIDQYKSIILLTSDKIVVRADSTYRVTPISPDLNLTVTKDKVNELTTAIQQINRSLPLMLIIVLFAVTIISFFIVFLSKIIYLIPITILVYLVARAYHKDIAYSKVYQIAFHAITTPFLLETFISINGIVLAVPFWNFVTHAIFVLGGVYEIVAKHPDVSVKEWT